MLSNWSWQENLRPHGAWRLAWISFQNDWSSVLSFYHLALFVFVCIGQTVLYFTAPIKYNCFFAIIWLHLWYEVVPVFIANTTCLDLLSIALSSKMIWFTCHTLPHWLASLLPVESSYSIIRGGPILLFSSVTVAWSYYLYVQVEIPAPRPEVCRLSEGIVRWLCRLCFLVRDECGV